MPLSVIHLSMQTTKTYVRKVYVSYFLGDSPVTKTFMYIFPDDLVPMALDHGTQRDEVYELVTETVSSISSARLKTLVKVGLIRDKAAREATDRAEDEREYARLTAKLGKSK